MPPDPHGRQPNPNPESDGRRYGDCCLCWGMAGQLLQKKKTTIRSPLQLYGHKCMPMSGLDRQ